MKTKLKFVTTILTLVVLLVITIMTVYASPLRGTRVACPNGGAPCTGCVKGGNYPDNYFCNSSGWVVNYTSRCIQQGPPLVCNYEPICHCMPLTTSDHCCSSYADCYD